ncbi:hypothetical protein VK70_01165 [Paenibacillus durus ATCC 35681]|uniref:Uncharacterized protein n=1 Tax=Paenibacillus durus ATCC 35681 TaxID=1333534 RepID=A0A0F7F6P2_PAEDU|nr:hypothetical protein VK70_01165 [Paenibacillus durus ATCC 35681]
MFKVRSSSTISIFIINPESMKYPKLEQSLVLTCNDLRSNLSQERIGLCPRQRKTELALKQAFFEHMFSEFQLDKLI